MARLVTDEDAARIQGLITDIERRTAGEIVTVIAARCDDYAVWRIPWAAALSVVLGLVLYWTVPVIPTEWVFVAQLPIGFSWWWLTGRSSILRRIVPAAALSERVDARARELFVERGVTETRDRSGVLLLISEAEHRVEILADRGIHARMGPDRWEQYTQRIIDAIHQGRAAEGICSTLQDIGSSLAELFPIRPADTNELSDTVHRIE